MKTGKVFLVGAGPGDPGLLTVKAVQCLQNAEVIVYDHLANPELLSLASRKAECIFAGKYPHNHVLFQKEINRLLVGKAKKGKTVVRLKGGDPLLFGRGAEEALALAQAGIPFEIVPGVSSAYAVAAYAGIPVTYRNISSRLNIVTGHETPDKGAATIPWKTLLDHRATLVILMGFGNLAKIVMELTTQRRSARSTPVAVISNGTLPTQQVVTGTLADIVGKVRVSGMRPPALIVVGEVVSLRKKLDWFSSPLPLQGKRILITRPAHQTSSLAGLLEAQGAKVISVPLIKIVPAAPASQMREKLKSLSEADVIVFSSVNGVDIFMKAAGKNKIDLKKKQFAAIGPKTAEEIGKYGFPVDIVPEKFVQESLAEILIKKVSRRKSLLLAHAEGARPVLEKMLRKAGYAIQTVDLYKAQPIPSRQKRVKELLEAKSVDAAILTSSSCADSFASAFETSSIQRLTKDLVVAAIGPITAATARKAGMRVTVESQEHTVEGVTQALADHFITVSST